MCQDEERLDNDEKARTLRRILPHKVVLRIADERRELLERLAILDEAIALIRDNPHVAKVVLALIKL